MRSHRESPAAVLAALTLTEAVFLHLALPAPGFAAAPVRHARRMAVAAALAMIVFAVPVGGWTARNAAVAGSFALAEARGGIAHSTREVFSHMTLAQYAAAFV